MAQNPNSVPGDEEHLPYPAVAPVAFFGLNQTTRPRNWCLKVACSVYPLLLLEVYHCLTPGMRALMNVLLHMTPMIINVFILYIFIINIFAVVGVQLWAGELRNRCFLGEDTLRKYNVSMSPFYKPKDNERFPFICSPEGEHGARRCSDVPPYMQNGKLCSLDVPDYASAANHSFLAAGGVSADACINWHMYYNVCRTGIDNPHNGAVNFDHIGYAWLTIFQVVTLEGWTEIMFYVMDAHSFWSFIVFIPVTIMGSFVMMNVCAVIIVNQFAESRQRDRGQRPAGGASIAWLCDMLASCLRVIGSIFKSRRRDKVHPKEGSIESSLLVHIWTPFKRRLKCIVDSKLFNQVIMFAIFLSVVTMAIEHHGQPKALTWMLKVTNIAFIITFIVEVAMKLLALSGAYFWDPSNVFDFLIVISSVLGIQLFGNKVSFQTKNGVTDHDNFDTIPWSMVTVFKILTQEDWNLVLYSAMSATSPLAALYFVWLIVLEKNIVLNILMGIVVESFQERDAVSGDCSPSGRRPSRSTEVNLATETDTNKVLAHGLVFGKETYLRSPWNVVDAFLVVHSLVDVLVSLVSRGKNKKLGILKVLRLLRTLRPLRVIKRAPKLKLAVEALISSVKPIGNIALICCTFFLFFGILGVQLFKGKFYYCVGEDTRNITSKSDCLSANYQWVRKTYNFDNLLQALLSLFVMFSKDGWVSIMHDGLDAVGVDKQPVKNHNEWMLLFFISFMVISFILLDMFIGVMVDTFHQCQQEQKIKDERLQEQEKEEMQVERGVLKAKRIKLLLRTVIKTLSQDTLRPCRPGDGGCLSYLHWVSPIFFTSFVVMGQFVLVNLVVAAIMQALEDSNEVDYEELQVAHIINEEKFTSDLQAEKNNNKLLQEELERLRISYEVLNASDLFGLLASAIMSTEAAEPVISPACPALLAHLQSPTAPACFLLVQNACGTNTNTPMVLRA
ncbi:Voltage-dependent T-type calcium channel subunit alpha-1H [Nibea albiflora]|uniref:Voltage-dependent T-type calcium channel subunit alpha-1H n=1 Tax=Nibea albiflora TaxID=240163 RepID=A0ACB7EM28_NIBAL|nr:Voltage-dependent T-type calcium channel subunit alpha-1H [Nibea albiflora]